MADPTSTPSRRRRLGQVLIDAGVIDEEQLETALVAQSSTRPRRRLGAVLRDLDYADDEDIVGALSAQLGIGVVEGPSLHAADQATLDRVPRRLAARHDLVPLSFDPETGTLRVAMADPTNVVAVDDLRTLEGVRNIDVAIGRAAAIERAQGLLYERGLADAAMEELGAELVEDDEDESGDADAADEPVIRLVNAILADAVRSRASDVHIEPEKNGMRVRHRIDGLLRVVQHIPKALAPAVTSRLKIMSSLDIAERRRPQDGRATIRVDGAEVDLRVSTLPSLHGETTVLRLLRKGAERLLISDLGLDDEQRHTFESAINRSQGLIVMTGPTGSGKTTTLYAGLSELAEPIRNVITLEDPVEYELEGINQTQMNPRIGLTFAAGLRSVLRQDPDVVMVGEVRDGETAQLAVEASFTGHLVLSTLHTNDAPSTVARLAELGVERFLLGTTLLLVVAQRLARRVCDDCAEATEPTEDVLRELGLSYDDVAGDMLMAGLGCEMCDGTGYRGRVGLYEFLRVSGRMRQLISDGGSELQVGALARAEGMRSLRQDGIDKARKGVVTLEEVARVTPEDQFRDEVTDGDAAATAIRVGAVDVHRLFVVGTGDDIAESLPMGWRTSVEEDARSAVERIQAESPDVVLVRAGDIGLRNTVTLIRMIRDKHHDARPIVVRSPTPLDSGTLERLRGFGISEVLTGDLDEERLRGVLLAQVRGA